MSENLRFAAAGVLAKINTLLTAAKGNAPGYTLRKVTEYLEAFKVQLKDALRLDEAEQKLEAMGGTKTLSADYAMNNDELRQAINDTVAQLRPAIIGIHLSEASRQTLCNHLDYLLLAERERVGVMFAHTEAESDTTKPGAQQT